MPGFKKKSRELWHSYQLQPLRRGAIYNGSGGQTVGLAKILDNTRDAKVLTITRNTRD